MQFDKYIFEKPSNTFFEPQNGDKASQKSKHTPIWYTHLKYILYSWIWISGVILLILMTILYVLSYILYNDKQDTILSIFDKKGIQNLYNLICISAFSGMIGNFLSKNE